MVRVLRYKLLKRLSLFIVVEFSIESFFSTITDNLIYYNNFQFEEGSVKFVFHPFTKNIDKSPFARPVN